MFHKSCDSYIWNITTGLPYPFPSYFTIHSIYTNLCEVYFKSIKKNWKILKKLISWGIRKSGRGTYLVLEKTACFLLQKNLFFLLQNKNSHNKITKITSPTLFLLPIVCRGKLSNTVYKTWFTLTKFNFELKLRKPPKKVWWWKLET